MTLMILSEWIPSSPASMFNNALHIFTSSFTWIASEAEVMDISPPAICSASLDSMPCLYSDVMIRLPFPLIVRSSWVKTVPFAPSSFASSQYSSPEARVFTVPSLSVMNTFSACLTYTAALSEQFMFTPSSISHTLDELYASTIMLPSDNSPLIRYFPPPDITRSPSRK